MMNQQIKQNTRTAGNGTSPEFSLKTSKEVIRKGFLFSFIIQFFIVTIPHVIWKSHVSPGLIDGYLDIFAVVLLGILLFIIISIVSGAIMKKKRGGGGIRRFLIVLSIAGNGAGILYLLIGLVTGMGFTLDLNGSFDTSALLPFILLAISFSFQAIACILIFTKLSITKDQVKDVIAWGLIFSMIPISSMFLAQINPVISGGSFFAFFTTNMLFGLVAFVINQKDLLDSTGKQTVSNSTDGLDKEWARDSMENELKGTNVIGYIFLLSFLLFHFAGPLFRYDTAILQNLAVIQVLPLVIAFLITVALAPMGTTLFRNRLTIAMALNIICVAMLYTLDCGNVYVAILYSSILGLAIGLVVEPIARSLAKFRLQAHPVVNSINFSWIAIILSGLLTLVGAFFITERGEIDAYGELVVWVFFLLLAVPLLFTANFSTVIKKNGKNWKRCVLQVLLLIGYISLMLVPVITTLIEGGII
ncbi:MAG: hypothetical protein ACTSUE_00125 [Promethearchaeota archaeon]